MQRSLILTVCCFMAFSAIAIGADHNSGKAQFEKLKSLAGQWQGQDPKGNDVAVSYEIVSNGSAVMERIEGNEPGMVTMYHLNGDELMMTHYCAAMNQPRMKAKPSDENISNIEFDMFDITNLPNHEAGHMHKLVMSFKDTDHITHAWTFMEAGKDMTVPFELTRVKMSEK